MYPAFTDHIVGARTLGHPNFLPYEIWLVVDKALYFAKRKDFIRKWNKIFSIAETFPLYVMPKSRLRITSPIPMSFELTTDHLISFYSMVIIKVYRLKQTRVRLFWSIFETVNDDGRSFDYMFFRMRCSSANHSERFYQKILL